MKEHGILMSQAMIQAYIAGRKTMTRRTSPRWAKAQAGDGLWFRETWLQWDWEDLGTEPNDPSTLRYRADGEIPAVKWRPSLFMPRRAARFTPPILEIRKERLQDITEEDAIVEGVAPNWIGDLSDWIPEEHGYLNYLIDDPDSEEHRPLTARESFETLWDRINSHKPGESWSDNPIVYPITFPRYEQ